MKMIVLKNLLLLDLLYDFTYFNQLVVQEVVCTKMRQCCVTIEDFLRSVIRVRRRKRMLHSLLQDKSLSHQFLLIITRVQIQVITGRQIIYNSLRKRLTPNSYKNSQD